MPPLGAREIEKRDVVLEFDAFGREAGKVVQLSQTGEDVDVEVLGRRHILHGRVFAEQVLCASQWDRKLAYKDKWFGSADDYAKLFEKELKYPAPYQAAESTASVLVFADAFARAGSLDPEKVRDAIASTDMMTFFGPIKFDSTGKNVVKPMVLYQVLGGDYKVVAPTKWAETKLVWPRKLPQ